MGDELVCTSCHFFMRETCTILGKAPKAPDTDTCGLCCRSTDRIPRIDVFIERPKEIEAECLFAEPFRLPSVNQSEDDEDIKLLVEIADGQKSHYALILASDPEEVIEIFTAITSAMRSFPQDVVLHTFIPCLMYAALDCVVTSIVMEKEGEEDGD